MGLDSIWQGMSFIAIFSAIVDCSAVVINYILDYTVSQKNIIFVRNFDKCLPVLWLFTVWLSDEFAIKPLSLYTLHYISLH